MPKKKDRVPSEKKSAVLPDRVFREISLVAEAVDLAAIYEESDEDLIDSHRKRLYAAALLYAAAMLDEGGGAGFASAQVLRNCAEELL